MGIGRRLVEAMEARKVIPAELARRSGVDDATISATIKRDGKTSQFAIQFAQALQVSLPWLLSGVGSMDDEHIGQGSATQYYFPTSYENVFGGAGSGHSNEEPPIAIGGLVPIPLERILERGWKPERLQVARSRGLSMYPTINDGEPVIIHLDETLLISGLIFAVEHSTKGLLFKRLFDEGDGRIRLASDSRDEFTFPPEWINRESQARIVGRVYRTGELLIPAKRLKDTR